MSDKLVAAQAIAARMGYNNWSVLGEDAKAICLDLASAALSATATPPKAAEPERSIRVLRGFVEVWSIKGGKRGAAPYECACVSEARRIAAGWSRGSPWERGSDLPIIELGPEAPEPRDGDGDGHYICSILRNQNGCRVFSTAIDPATQRLLDEEDRRLKEVEEQRFLKVTSGA